MLKMLNVTEGTLLYYHFCGCGVFGLWVWKELEVLGVGCVYFDCNFGFVFYVYIGLHNIIVVGVNS